MTDYEYFGELNRWLALDPPVMGAFCLTLATAAHCLGYRVTFDQMRQLAGCASPQEGHMLAAQFWGPFFFQRFQARAPEPEHRNLEPIDRHRFSHRPRPSVG